MKYTNIQSLFFIALIPVLIGAFIPTAKAVEYGGVGGRPAYPRSDNPRTDSIFVHNANPGDVIKEGVTVINNTNESKTLSVYGGDYIPSSGGGFACRQFTEQQTEVGSWIELSKKEVTLEPKTNELIPFTISVPKNASVGENDGCILIEEKKMSAVDDGEKAGVSLRFRTGLRVVVTIPGDIVKKLDILNFNSTKKGDKNILLSAQVKNSGNVSIDTDVKIVTRDMFNREIADHGGEFSILRGQTSDYNFELKQPFWGGLFSANLSAAYDPSITVELGKKSDEKRVTLTAKKIVFFSPPTPLAAVIEIVVLLLVLFLLTRVIKKKKQDRWIANKWVRYTVQKGDTINSLASKHSVSWKLIVRANNMQPPFVMEQGNTIRLPLIKKNRDVLAVLPVKKPTASKVKKVPSKTKLKTKTKR
ncbi:MAG: LysM domain-containing protein [Patescibacteria group bacterium]